MLHMYVWNISVAINQRTAQSLEYSLVRKWINLSSGLHRHLVNDQENGRHFRKLRQTSDILVQVVAVAQRLKNSCKFLENGQQNGWATTLQSVGNMRSLEETAYFDHHQDGRNGQRNRISADQCHTILDRNVKAHFL